MACTQHTHCVFDSIIIWISCRTDGLFWHRWHVSIEHKKQQSGWRKKFVRQRLNLIASEKKNRYVCLWVKNRVASACSFSTVHFNWMFCGSIYVIMFEHAINFGCFIGKVCQARIRIKNSTFSDKENQFECLDIFSVKKDKCSFTQALHTARSWLNGVIVSFCGVDLQMPHHYQ